MCIVFMVLERCSQRLGIAHEGLVLTPCDDDLLASYVQGFASAIALINLHELDCL